MHVSEKAGRGTARLVSVGDVLPPGASRSMVATGPGDNGKKEREGPMRLMLPFWQRLLLTLVVMLVTSYVAGLLWERLTGYALPSYAAGAIGGLAALPVWDLLKRIRPSAGA
jgi:hypothetical protein